ncbi:hypothetical protein CXF86_18920 [Shewanella sp. GutCb]|uniref:hypothetical protein n=1 Tax=Shewanella sp. GutCb TaxID=2058315 RepID=UPI000C79D1A3|nr:hypothetical protein [Shewanella sp. GutCb]PKG73179.1 hypothetical protein CXF86_18920 [Shewanella sp. GutCb]
MLSFPADIYPTQCDWRLVRRTKAFRNPYNNQLQTLSLPGAYWQAQLTFDKLSRAQGAQMHAFVVKMQGMAGRTKLHDHAIINPAYTSTPVVSGVGQLGKQLKVGGCFPGLFLPSGYYVQVGEQLLVLTDDAVADAGGACRLQFEPALRQSPPNGTALVIDKPSATMMFTDDNQGMRRSSKRLVLSSFSLSFVEDIYS